MFARRTTRVRAVAAAILETALAAAIFAMFARAFVLQAYVIPTASMERSLLAGDHVLVNNFIYAPEVDALLPLLPKRAVRRGDVVVLRPPGDPGRDYIKRCVGLPGDQLELADKQLSIDGVELQDAGGVWHGDPRVFGRGLGLDPLLVRRDNFGPYVVPDEQYFCLGDNRDDSMDSRYWGSVPRAAVRGRALLIYWSSVPADGAHTGLPGMRWLRTLRVVR